MNHCSYVHSLHKEKKFWNTSCSFCFQSAFLVSYLLLSCFFWFRINIFSILWQRKFDKNFPKKWKIDEFTLDQQKKSKISQFLLSKNWQVLSWNKNTALDCSLLAPALIFCDVIAILLCAIKFLDKNPETNWKPKRNEKNKGQNEGGLKSSLTTPCKTPTSMIHCITWSNTLALY